MYSIRAALRTYETRGKILLQSLSSFHFSKYININYAFYFNHDFLNFTISYEKSKYYIL